MKIYTFVLTICLCFMALSACSRKKPDDSQRYVVLSPEVAEIIVSFGAGDDIVGVTAECTYPEILKGKQIVGNFGSLDKEKIIELNPTVIFCSALEQEAISTEFEKLGYKVVSYYPQSIEECLEGMLQIGEEIGKSNKADSLVSYIRTEIEDIKQISSGFRRPKIYIEIYRDPLMSASDKSFVGELIELAGGDNIFNVLERDYARIDAEKLIELNPDIIICYSQDTMQGISSRKGWQHLQAVRNKAIYFEKDINPDWIQRAGPRMILGLRKLQEIYLKWNHSDQI